MAQRPVSNLARTVAQRHAETSLYGRYAGVVSRAIAVVVDAIIILSIGALTILFIALLPDFIRIVTLVDPRDVLPQDMQRLLTALSNAVAGVALVTFAFAYNVFWLVAAGRSPGKSLMGLRVVSITGKRLGFRRAVVRTAASAFSGILTLFLGYGLALIDARHQTLHDKIARTLVLYYWEAKPDEEFFEYEIKRELRAKG